MNRQQSEILNILLARKIDNFRPSFYSATSNTKRHSTNKSNSKALLDTCWNWKQRRGYFPYQKKKRLISQITNLMDDGFTKENIREILKHARSPTIAKEAFYQLREGMNVKKIIHIIGITKTPVRPNRNPSHAISEKDILDPSLGDKILEPMEYFTHPSTGEIFEAYKR